MNYKIVSDSSADILSLEQVDFQSVPMHVLVGDQDFADDENLDIAKMQEQIDSYKGPSSTSCPSPDSWLTAFGDAEVVFCLTITSGLSGSYSSANAAKQIYESEFPGRKVYVFDSISAGPGMTLMLEKLKEMVVSGMEHEEIAEKFMEYKESVKLYYSLASLNNFAKNGRVNALLAKGIGLLGIRVLATASEDGKVLPIDKCHGDKKAIRYFIKYMKENGYTNGKIVMAHHNNEAITEELKNRIIDEFGSFNGYIHKTRGLCSYYAEPGSMLIAFEV